MREKISSVCPAALVPVHHKSRGDGNISTSESFKNKILQCFVFVRICFCEICSDDNMNFGSKCSSQINVFQHSGKSIIAFGGELYFVMRIFHSIKRNLHLSDFHSLQSSYIRLVEMET